jgi:cytochrome c peroxidase
MFIAVLVAALCWSVAPAYSADASVMEMKKRYTRPSSIPFPEENPYTIEKANLGRTLYFDPRLSGSNQLTCAFCHNPGLGWSDGQSLGFGHGMKRLGRKTPTILNLAWSEPLMWDGRFDTLEEQALGPVGAGAEMAQPLETLVAELEQVAGYRTLFNIVFPGEGISLDNIAKAIATFERTVVSAIAPFDRYIAGEESAISDAAKRGFVLYNTKAKCSACHDGWNFTDDSFHDIGLPNTKREITSIDGQTLAAGSDLGRGAFFKNLVPMQFAFKTPGLRNLEDRAPFMHDGSLHTIMDVVQHYNTGGMKRPSLSAEITPLNMTEMEMKDLVAFLETLTSNDPAISVPVLPR